MCSGRGRGVVLCDHMWLEVKLAHVGVHVTKDRVWFLWDGVSGKCHRITAPMQTVHSCMLLV